MCCIQFTLGLVFILFPGLRICSFHLTINLQQHVYLDRFQVWTTSNGRNSCGITGTSNVTTALSECPTRCTSTATSTSAVRLVSSSHRWRFVSQTWEYFFYQNSNLIFIRQTKNGVNSCLLEYFRYLLDWSKSLQCTGWNLFDFVFTKLGSMLPLPDGSPPTRPRWSTSWPSWYWKNWNY